MSRVFISVAVPFLAGREQRVNDFLDTLGNPAGCGHLAVPPRTEALSDSQLGRLREFVHFMSMMVVPENGGRCAFLMIEVCADEPPDGILHALVSVMGDTLCEVIEKTGNAPPSKDRLPAYLEEHQIDAGIGWHARTAGLMYEGTPGMTVKRIRDEARLAVELRQILDAKQGQGPALDKLKYARAVVFRDVELKWAFVSEPVPLLAPAQPRGDLLRSLIYSAWRDLLWPFVFPPLLVGFWSRRTNTPDVVAWHVVLAVCIELLIAAGLVTLGYLRLRRQEESDVPVDVEPAPDHVKEMMARENHPGVVQNHLGGVSVLKLGWVRPWSLRVALWLIGELARGRSRPGFLDQIGTIHFARWLRLPGTDRLVFLSNYDGSWQSYLEDFIARLRQGLTSVWSNTRNFPKTANLVGGGAGDGARFKRWARCQQLPTRFWFSGYPDLTTSRIRSNAAIRHGFASASTEIAAAKWLAQFGYVTPETVDADEISVLAFGGLSPLPFARCLVVELAGTEAAPAPARKWLRAIKADVSHGAHVPATSALVVAFTSSGLSKLGVEEESRKTFPTAFQHGMSAQGRARALGDLDTSKWSWGGTGKAANVDAVLLLYAVDDGLLAKESAWREQQLGEFKHAVLRTVPLAPISDEKDGANRRVVREPFGFRDGISQPIMRGHRDWSSPRQALHVVEPGELVLGYRDNLDKLGPSPSIRGRDIGRNGSFLVIRQLEQDKAKFDTYVAGKANELAGDKRIPDEQRALPADWIKAKMVGRWQDGTSLVRHPERPGLAERPPMYPDNDFKLGSEDPEGLRCPMGSHIRRANPRDSFQPGSEVQIAITNRHRILRVGRNYEPQGGEKPGLLFMCVNADIERQFEFLQQTWLLGPNFHGLDSEIDPLVGFRDERDSMTVPTPGGPLRLRGLSEFIRPLGGGYFFLPSRSALDFLAQ